MQDKESGTNTCRADVYLKVHTDPRTNKPHPVAESLMVTFKLFVKYNYEIYN